MAIELGSGVLIPGFERPVDWQESNDEVLVKVTFPDDLNVERSEGQGCHLRCCQIPRSTEPTVARPTTANGQIPWVWRYRSAVRTASKGQSEQELKRPDPSHMKRKAARSAWLPAMII